MAMAMAMAFVLLLFVLVAPAVHSLQYGVTWNLGINYNAWAAGKTFTVGDTLVFTYTSELHSVDVVDGSDYADCNTGNPLDSYTGGLTTITLAAPGPIYFICPIEGHCQAGMKLGITVVAAASPTTPTSPPTSSTTTPTSPPPASTTTPTSPPPSSTTAPTSPPPSSATTPTSTPSPSPSVSPSPAITSPSSSPSSGPSPTTSTTPVITTAPSSPKSSSGAGSMFGEMNHLVVIGLSVVVAALAGFLV